MVWESSKQGPGSSSSDKCTADPLKPEKSFKKYIWGNFKERGEQYRTIWDNMEIGATMICLHLKPD